MKKEFVFRLAIALCIFFLVYQFGVRPIFVKPSDNGKWTEGFSLNDGPDYDVVVLGEDPEGIAAAVSAARLGARTLLLAEGGDLGGIVARCKLARLEMPSGQNSRLLNGGLLSELYKKLDSQFSVNQYIETVTDLVQREKKTLDVEYGAAFASPILEGGRLSGVNAKIGTETQSFRGRFFIDATRDGSLLEACKVPFFTGSGDLNLAGSFMPAMLNFEMAGPLTNEIKKLINNQESKFLKGISDYKVQDPGIRIDNMKVYFTEDGKIVIVGIEAANVNPTDAGQVARAYGTAVKEAENLALYLSAKFKEFEGWKYSGSANAFYFRENRHFSGLYRLDVNEVLENKYFDDTVAMGSYPVQSGKFADRGVYLAGEPVQYGIPLGCLVPPEPGNLMMVGAKASYSSLASTSAGALGVGIAEGEASGVTAVYSLTRNTDPADILRDRDRVRELRDYLVSQKMYLPFARFSNKNADNWSYPAVRQLLTLGLIAGGEKNDYRFETAAVEKDLAYILLNGVYRLGEGKYNLEMDSRIRPHLNDNALTKEKAALILDELYGEKAADGSAYRIACEKRYINDVMQLRLKDKKSLTLDDVYYLGAYNIKLYTGKDIKD